MRTMLKWTVPVEKGNEAIKDGTLMKTMEDMMEQLKPEAAYFATGEGERGGFFVFDMSDPSQIPLIAEPLFLNLNASVEFAPVMNSDDLRKALEKVSG